VEDNTTPEKGRHLIEHHQFLGSSVINLFLVSWRKITDNNSCNCAIKTKNPAQNWRQRRIEPWQCVLVSSPHLRPPLVRRSRLKTAAHRTVARLSGFFYQDPGARAVLFAFCPGRAAYSETTQPVTGAWIDHGLKDPMNSDSPRLHSLTGCYSLRSLYPMHSVINYNNYVVVWHLDGALHIIKAAFCFVFWIICNYVVSLSCK
jgi:hypothetical protein